MGKNDKGISVSFLVVCHPRHQRFLFALDFPFILYQAIHGEL
jgi:hypothetical protein